MCVILYVKYLKEHLELQFGVCNLVQNTLFNNNVRYPPFPLHSSLQVSKSLVEILSRQNICVSCSADFSYFPIPFISIVIDSIHLKFIDLVWYLHSYIALANQSFVIMDFADLDVFSYSFNRFFFLKNVCLTTKLVEY